MVNIEDVLGDLNLKVLGRHTFSGNNYNINVDHVYGGQVLSQSLDAAYRTVSPDRKIHSLHAYFLLPGYLNHAIDFQVQCLRDGKTFSFRSITALQKGRAIFQMLASFHLEEKGFEHQAQMPQVPNPNNLISEIKELEPLITKYPAALRRYNILKTLPIEYRSVEYLTFKKQQYLPHRHLWFKFNGKIEDNIRLRKRSLTFISDYNLVLTALLPHLHVFDFSQYHIASLDHSMWFHRDFDMDSWFLYELESTNANNTRGFTKGNIFAENGDLIVSISQECLIRRKN